LAYGTKIYLETLLSHEQISRFASALALAEERQRRSIAVELSPPGNYFCHL